MQLCMGLPSRRVHIIVEVVIVAVVELGDNLWWSDDVLNDLGTDGVVHNLPYLERRSKNAGTVIVSSTATLLL